MNESEVIEKNYGLAVAVAMRYFCPSSVYSLEDLIQQGLIGITKAHRRFDPEKAKFSTYATVCARNEIMRFLKSVKKQPINLNSDCYTADRGLWELLPSTLTTDEETVVTMKSEGYTNTEICGIVDMPKNLFNSTLASAYKKIRKSLDE